MIQVSRGADQNLRGVQMCHSTGWIMTCCLPVGFFSVAAMWFDRARPCRGLQDCTTQDSAVPGRDAVAVSSQSGSGDWAAPLDGSLRSKDDSLPTGAHWTTTFGDSVRQDLSLAMGLVARYLRVRRSLMSQSGSAKSETMNRLVTIMGRRADDAMHVRGLMGSGASRWNVSVTATKNDNRGDWQFVSCESAVEDRPILRKKVVDDLETSDYCTM